MTEPFIPAQPQPRPFQRRGPSGPLGNSGGGDVQVGYDQTVESLTIPVPDDDFAIFPRNVGGDPVEVILIGVTPGNYLEVDYRLNLESANLQHQFGFEAVAIVTFDGSVPTVPSATTFLIVDSWATSYFQDITGGEGSIPDKQSMSGLCAVLIPDGAVEARVCLLYASAGTTVVDDGGGLGDATGLSASLKATEKDAEVVTQAGPGNLVATT